MNPVSPHSGFLQSPPSMRQPSPAVPSPANPSGSPFPSAASPLGGSPRSKPSPRFAGTSPKPVVGGGASSSSHLAYTRTLPARLWAGAIPTVLPIKAFHEIFRPTSVGNSGITIPPVHRFVNYVEVGFLDYLGFLLALFWTEVFALFPCLWILKIYLDFTKKCLSKGVSFNQIFFFKYRNSCLYLGFLVVCLCGGSCNTSLKMRTTSLQCQARNQSLHTESVATVNTLED